MYRQPTTMLVKAGGTTELRNVSHYDRCNNRYAPVLKPGEDVVWSVGNPVPQIVQVTIITHTDEPEHCAMCDFPFFNKRCTRCGYEPA